MRCLWAVTLLWLVGMGYAQEPRPYPLESSEPPRADTPTAPSSRPIVAPLPTVDANIVPAAYTQVNAVGAYPAGVPVVTLTLRAPATAGTGETVEYRLVAENRSTAAAHHVTIIDALPTGAKLLKASPEPDARRGPAGELLWSLGTMPPGSRREVTLSVTSEGVGELRHCAHIRFEHGQCVVTKIEPPRLIVRIEGPREALANQPIPLRVEVINPGTVEVADVEVIGQLPEGCQFDTANGRQRSWKIGNLAANQRRVVECSAILPKPGNIVCQAHAIARGGLRTEGSWAVQVVEPKLSLSHTGPATRYVGQLTTYVLTVRNTGSAALTNVVLTDTLPSGASVVKASAGADFHGETVQWTFPRLEPGATHVLTLQVRVSEGGKRCNRASLSAGRLSAQQEDVCTEFITAPALQLEVQQSANPLEINGTNVYTLTVRNAGSAPASAVQLTLALPAQLALRQASPPAKNEGGLLTFDVATLAAGQSLSYTVEVQAREVGDLRVTARLAAEKFAGAMDEVQTTVFR